MPSWVHKVSFSNFVAIARLVVLRGRIQGQQVRFPVSLIHYFDFHVVLATSFLKKSEYNEGKFHQQMPNKFQAKSLTLTEHSLSVFVTVTVSNVVRF